MNFTTALRAHNHALDNHLQRVSGGRITVRAYKWAAFTLRVAAFAVLSWVMINPALIPSATMLLVIAAVVLGPDVVEAYLTRDQ